VSLSRFFNYLIGKRRLAGLLCASAALLVLTGCPRQDSAQTLKRADLRAPEGQPVMLAAYQPWFGKPSHINVGYSSLDRVDVIQEAEAGSIVRRGEDRRHDEPGPQLAQRLIVGVSNLGSPTTSG
jgi:hypothetical protein